MHEHGRSVCLSSLVLGAVAGAGVALLMAPRSGSETMSFVSRTAREGAGHARDVACRAKERGRHLAEAAAGGRGTVVSFAQEGGESTTALRDYASTADYRGL